MLWLHPLAEPDKAWKYVLLKMKYTDFSAVRMLYRLISPVSGFGLRNNRAAARMKAKLRSKCNKRR